MSNISILAVEGSLSDLKEFIMREISLTCTLQDHPETARPKDPMRYPAHRHPDSVESLGLCSNQWSGMVSQRTVGAQIVSRSVEGTRGP